MQCVLRHLANANKSGAVLIAKVEATTNREALKRPHESAQAIANEVKFLEQYEFWSSLSCIHMIFPYVEHLSDTMLEI